MSFFQVHFKLQPMAGLAVVQRPLASANEGVGTGLEIQIRLRPHGLDDVNDRWETPGRFVRSRELCQFNILRPDAQ